MKKRSMLTQLTGILVYLQSFKVRFRALQRIGAAALCSMVRASATARKVTLQEWKLLSTFWRRNLSLCFVLSVWLSAVCLVGVSIARSKTSIAQKRFRGEEG